MPMIEIDPGRDRNDEIRSETLRIGLTISGLLDMSQGDICEFMDFEQNTYFARSYLLTDSHLVSLTIAPKFKQIPTRTVEATFHNGGDSSLNVAIVSNNTYFYLQNENDILVESSRMVRELLSIVPRNPKR